MRMWMVPPELMCRKHLLGEHVELHMFVGTLNKGISVAGFLANNLMEPASMHVRHRALVDEMTRRGYKHKSELPYQRVALPAEQHFVTVDAEASLAELLRRCPECSKLHNARERQ